MRPSSALCRFPGHRSPSHPLFLSLSISLSPSLPRSSTPARDARAQIFRGFPIFTAGGEEYGAKRMGMETSAIRMGENLDLPPTFVRNCRIISIRNIRAWVDCINVQDPEEKRRGSIIGVQYSERLFPRLYLSLVQLQRLYSMGAGEYRLGTLRITRRTYVNIIMFDGNGSNNSASPRERRPS